MVLQENRKMLKNTLLFQNQDIESFDLQSLKYKLNYYSGIIKTEESERFKRILFRISKGNAWTHVIPIDIRDEIEEETEPISVYLTVFQGGMHQIL